MVTPILQASKGILVLRHAHATTFVGGSGLNRDLIKKMTRRPIVFALANPHPEVEPDDIADLGAVIATGSSDYPNQVNNALAFPGLFQGLLGSSTARLDEQVFLAAAHALANLAKPATPTRLLPEVLDPRVAPAIAAAVQDATRTDPPDAPTKGITHG